MKKSEFFARKESLRLLADKAGFLSVGFSPAGFLEDDAIRLENFLNQNYQGEMGYLERNFDKRLDPTLLVPDAKTVISLLYNYFPEKIIEGDFKVAKYAYGEDYHHVIKDKIKTIWDEFLTQNHISDSIYRIFTDSAPVLEKSWAAKSGLGWVGKNGNLLSKKRGSFFFIAEIITDIDFPTDFPTISYCGSCTRCIDACPTGAIVADAVIDGSRCISYATIELKNEIPQEFQGKMDNWVYGCDICQDVCPWNRHSIPHNESKFTPSEDFIDLVENNFEEINREVFKKVFSKSAVTRTRYEGLERNINLIKHVKMTENNNLINKI